MKRSDFQKLAAVRVNMAGYAAECAIKACIARRTERFEFPDKRKAEKSHTHSIANLIVAAELQPDLDRACAESPEFDRNWSIVQGWSEQSRYSGLRARGGNVPQALKDSKQGILRWLKKYW